MSLPVPNLRAPIASVKSGLAYLIPPWNSFFQQFVEPAPSVAGVATSPFTANAKGTVIFSGVAPSIILTRGQDDIDITGERIIPISIGDTLTWTGAPTVQFLGA